MIPTSSMGKALALAFALAAHGALALALMPPGQIEIAGSAGAAEAQLGASFADMAAGTLSALAPQEVIRTAPPTEPTATLPPPDPVAALPAPPLATPRPEPERIASTPPQARPTPRPQDQPRAQAQPPGNADRDARAGQETGRVQARAATSGRAGQAAEVGNAAISTYPGLVMRKLARVPRPRVDSHGAAVVAFRIADNGGLAGAALAQSSGSARLDQAALHLVQRAAPFPAPPSGAQRSFSIRIEGR
ncbi:energy transducer TonB family protein [Rhodovulum strictum]|uniref:TonB family protein n=1 Tax=Rhodovulum strictum TaxID=58314 RepID=A0A844B4S0_9RHOB|nr:TonB family protein [Rhodovulum strictum]MRH20700.1 TonB family protein [Rhodovulum strictum]